MKKIKQKSLKDFTTMSLRKDNLKMIKGGTDGGDSGTTNGIVTDDVIHV